MATTKYTKDEPFEFEGAQVWEVVTPGISRDIHYDFGHSFGRGNVPANLAGVLHAMIEAERNEWVYTNDEHTESRKGRWAIRFSPCNKSWFVTHDDFPGTEWEAVHENQVNTPPARRSAKHAIAVIDDFLAGHAAQNQPAEPTGFGYVGTITADTGCIYDVFRTDDERNPFTWTDRNNGETGISTWNNIPWRNTFKGDPHA